MQDGFNYYDGRFQEVASGGNGPFRTTKFNNTNPCNQESIGKFPQSGLEEVSHVCDAAKKAFEGWRKLSRVQRAEYLFSVAKIVERRSDELARAISLETGKNYNESVAEVNEALHMAQYAFGSGRTPICCVNRRVWWQSSVLGTSLWLSVLSGALLQLWWRAIRSF